MKKSFLKTLLITSVSALIISCGSTGAIPAEKQEEKTAPSTGRELKVVNTAQEVKKPAETPESIYLKKIEGITLSTVSSPKETSKNNAFSAPYVFKAVKADGTAAEGLEIAITFPETKSNGNINYGLATLTADSTGTVSFIPATASFAADTFVSAYPAGDVTVPAIADAAAKASVKAPYKVRTNFLSAGGTIAIVDFNKDGKPIYNNSVSSSNILMAIMRMGFKRVGNADFTNVILKDDTTAVYNAAKGMLGNVSSFLIFGTVKYATSVEKTEDGKYTLTLEGNITCLNMKDGSVFMTSSKTVTVKEDKDWNCLPNARKQLADQFAKEIYYGL